MVYYINPWIQILSVHSMHGLLHRAFTLSKSSRKLSYNISLKHNFE